MSYDLDDYYENRVKTKKRRKRHSYPNKHESPPPKIRKRMNSFPRHYADDEDEVEDDECSEMCIIKEYSGKQLKKEMMVKKRGKIHPVQEPEKAPEKEEPTDMELASKCLAMVSKKVVRLLCYIGVIV
jgi:hypothetical protein